MGERAPFSKQNGHTSDNLADTKNMISGQRDKDEARAHLREYQHYFLDILGNSETLNISEKGGARGRIRTTDTAIFSRLLYQLSYSGNRGYKAVYPEEEATL